MHYASTKLKEGKAPGYDNILNEMIKCLTEKYPILIIKLFNMILQSNCIIPDWLISLIVPIHKKGSKADPSNYRGISLLSCLPYNSPQQTFKICYWKEIVNNKPTWIFFIYTNHPLQGFRSHCSVRGYSSLTTAEAGATTRTGLQHTHTHTHTQPPTQPFITCKHDMKSLLVREQVDGSTALSTKTKYIHGHSTKLLLPEGTMV